jgi:methylmalonyl-CoA/ethylmalonyl-CoA epimerase
LLKKIYHLGYAVEDLAAAARFYREHFGASISEPEEVEEQGIVAMMLDVGESKIELVQPTRPDSPVGKFLAERGEGFHHVAYEVDDLEGALKGLKESGVGLIDEEPRGGAGGTRMAFLHPKDAHGVLTELIELPKDKDQERHEDGRREA